jgi:hypothetical protein
VDARVTTIARSGEISESEALMALGRSQGEGDAK